MACKAFYDKGGFMGESKSHAGKYEPGQSHVRDFMGLWEAANEEFLGRPVIYGI
jgi:hypothetical protein